VASLPRADIESFRQFGIAHNNVPRDAHIVIGASSVATMLEAGIKWPLVRSEWVCGPDGAVRHLILSLIDENVD
jgi:hypothetical protein